MRYQSITSSAIHSGNLGSERENLRLRRAVADLTLDKLILKEAVEWRESGYG